MRAGYGPAAPVYRTHGWEGVLHLPAGQKWPPPPGWTGRDAPYPNAATVARWCSNFPSGNLGLRLPETVLGVDVDAHKGGSLEPLVAACGELPRTWWSTSRTDGSGIFFFAVPAGVRWQESRAGHSIELIHRGHRYAVVWPSIHPEGRPYKWVDPDGVVTDEVPRVDALPRLPASWGRRLMQQSTAAVTQPGRVRRIGPPDAFDGLVRRVAEQDAQSGNRNNCLFWAACRAADGGAPPSVFRDLAGAAIANGLPERDAWTTVASAQRRARGAA